MSFDVKEKEAGKPFASKRMATVLATLCLLVACSGLVVGCSSGDTSGDSSNDSSDTPAAADTITVTVDIDSSRAKDLGYEDSMFSGEVTVDEGATVQDALVATGVAFDDSQGYVSSIEGLAGGTADYPSSGWLFYVDGESGLLGADEQTLEGGEKITWVFTLDFNEDIVLD